MENGTSSSKSTSRRQKAGRKQRSLLVRFLIGLLIVLVVGGLSFLIGYLIGLQLGAVCPLL